MLPPSSPSKTNLTKSGRRSSGGSTGSHQLMSTTGLEDLKALRWIKVIENFLPDAAHSFGSLSRSSYVAYWRLFIYYLLLRIAISINACRKNTKTHNHTNLK